MAYYKSLLIASDTAKDLYTLSFLRVAESAHQKLVSPSMSDTHNRMPRAGERTGHKSKSASGSENSTRSPHMPTRARHGQAH